MRRMSGRLGVVALGALAVALVAAVALPGATEAHALLVRSNPAVDARLQEPPPSITAWFSEPLDRSLSTMGLITGAGDRVETGDAVFSDADSTMMRIDLAEELEPGYYAVVWETLSSVDGHFLKGSFPLTVLNPDGTDPPGARPEIAGLKGGGEPKLDTVTTKVAGLVGAVGLIGGLAFYLWVVAGAAAAAPADWRERVREAGRRHALRFAWPALALLALVGLAEPFVQARQLGGLDLVDKVIGETDWGEHWLQRQVVLAAIVIALGAATWGRAREVGSRLLLWAALAGSLVYVLLVSLVSHAGAVEGSFWAVTADFVHLTSAAVWVGMVAQMGLALAWARREVPDGTRSAFLAAHLQRFSVLAAISVLALLATGTFSALTEIPEWSSFVDTSYGRVLLAKLVLVGLLLPVAALNAAVLRPRAIRAVPASRRAGLERLRAFLLRSIWLEAALAVCVLVLVGVLTQYPTSRVVVDSERNVQESAQAVQAFDSTAPAGTVNVNLNISPNSVGANSYRVTIIPAPGESVQQVLRVRLRFKPPDPSLGPSEVITDQVNPSLFTAVGSYFTTSGNWEVQVDVRRAQVDDVSAIFRVPVAGAGGLGGRDSYALPLVTGNWSLVTAAALAVALAMFWVPAQQWPRIHVRVARWFRMSAITCGVMGLALLLGVHQHVGLTDEQARAGNPVAATEESVARGRELYEQNCTQCHGLTGRGDGPLAGTLPYPPADFKQHVPYHPDRFFFEVITLGFGDVMPAFGDQLSEEDRWNLINFLRAEHSIEKQLE